jgi:polyisoprenoid-binding protein YceI
MPRSRLPIIAAIVVAVVAIGGFLAYRQFLAGDSVPQLTLPPISVASGTSGAAGTTTDPGATTSGTSAGTVVATPAGLAGTWSVGDGSVVGYRVREQLGNVTALSDAVGRTSAITGSATLLATSNSVQVTAAAFQADLSQLTSDDNRRDNRIRSIGLESNQFPTATFKLASAVDVPAAALSGTAVDISMTGDLTIHGVTKSVTIAGKAQLNGSRIQIVASLTFPFSDYGMSPPNIAGFVSVQNDATMEVLLSLAKG